MLFNFLPQQMIKKTNEVELTVYFKPTVKGKPGSVFYLEGAADQGQIQRLRGIRPKGVILDEYAQIDPTVWTEVLFPAINQSGGWVIFISTFKGKNHFYDLFSKYWDWSVGKQIDNKDWRAWYLPYHQNSYFTKDQEQRARDIMPPAQFDQEYGCLPMSGAANVFPSLADLMTGELREKHPQHFYSMGVDLAKYLDYTSVSIIDRNTHELVYQERWQSDWSATLEKLILIRNRYNKAKVTIDSTGVGDPIAEMLKKRGVPVEDFKFNQTSKDQLVRKMGVFFSEKRIKLPPIDQVPNLIFELEQFSYEILPSGKIRYSAPSGKHDDEVMSLGLAIWPLKDNPTTDLYATAVPATSVPQLDPYL